MQIPIALLSLSSAIGVLGHKDPAPQPKIVNITYWGSACPEGDLDRGLNVFIGTVNVTTNIAPLTFTLANFLPRLGSFESSLRMCNTVSNVIIDKGWKVVVNAQGTNAQGNTDLPGNATMFLRTTYSFAEKFEIQSIGMLNVRGPLTGHFGRRLTPENGDQGAVGPCGGGELVIEFQARAVADSVPETQRRSAPNETSWALTTDIVALRC
ncbi:hypothetical protein GQ44DRAFT_833120 [Phaeosphaeriaceae sp. PMI808]|nr:hypothetical protein GQ44DRAFT_833120 [Phaeosphaeriaceae sp. PMI808]